MKIGIIGAGEVALAVARFAAERGHEILLSSRSGPEAIFGKIAGLGSFVSAVSINEAASQDIVLLAVPWKNVASALSGLPAWNGRVLIDATNPFVEVSPKLVLDDLGNDSASEIVAKHAPDARIVKAFNSITMENFNDGPTRDGFRRILFVSGDHDEPKNVVRDFIESFGFAVVDLCGLSDGGRIQQAGGPLAGRDLYVSDATATRP